MPNKDKHAKYMDKYTIYKNAYKGLKNIYTVNTEV